MSWVVVSVLVLVVSGFLSLIIGMLGTKPARVASYIAVLGVLIAVGLSTQTIYDIFTGATSVWGDYFEFNWGLSFGPCVLGLDFLSAFFLATLLIVSALVSIYGLRYFDGHGESRSKSSWFWLNLLIASMVVIFIARDAILFITAWEFMTLSSFFLVTYEHENKTSREAGWIYLVASHIGVTFLIFVFLVLARESGSTNFAKLGIPSGFSSGIIFIAALIGFGIKAGIIPLHVWLPEAHPAAPSHVSAFMSGVMIKSGIYGILRILFLIHEVPAWWGWTLIIVGATSGVLGVLFALAQHDIKRLLAYHSVENIGIIFLGIGVGILGISKEMPILVVLGFGGGLLHVFNHAMFKSLLFLSAGAVIRETGTRDVDHLGGLIKKMPWTALAFLVGAIAISGLPPLNGFISEFLIYIGALKGLFAFTALKGPEVILMVLVIASLCIMGGLALACFAKVFGIVFLGEPRSGISANYNNIKEIPFLMKAPMVAFSLICIGTAFCSPFFMIWLFHLAAFTKMGILPYPPFSMDYSEFNQTNLALWAFLLFSIVLIVFIGLLYLIKRLALRKKTVALEVTWDCGYAAPTARMQYTASSFIDPFVSMFKAFLQPREETTRIHVFFPKTSVFLSEASDLFMQKIYVPIFRTFYHFCSFALKIQGGRVNIYILYIFLTMIALLFWKMG